MKALKLFVCASFLFTVSSCQTQVTPTDSNTEEDTVATDVYDGTVGTGIHSDPCDSPETVAQLLACAGKYGTIDSSKVINGAIANNGGCLKSWIDEDTVLLVWYSDSVTLYRVQPKLEYGSWFTNVNAYQTGLTKAETLDRYALNNCSDFNYDTCKCNGIILPPDSLIQYEVTVRIAPNREMQFGKVSPNRFGKGGNLQWHLVQRITPPYRILKEQHWN